MEGEGENGGRGRGGGEGESGEREMGNDNLMHALVSECLTVSVCVNVSFIQLVRASVLERVSDYQLTCACSSGSHLKR